MAKIAPLGSGRAGTWPQDIKLFPIYSATRGPGSRPQGVRSGSLKGPTGSSPTSPQATPYLLPLGNPSHLTTGAEITVFENIHGGVKTTTNVAMRIFQMGTRWKDR